VCECVCVYVCLCVSVCVCVCVCEREREREKSFAYRCHIQGAGVDTTHALHTEVTSRQESHAVTSLQEILEQVVSRASGSDVTSDSKEKKTTKGSKKGSIKASSVPLRISRSVDDITDEDARKLTAAENAMFKAASARDKAYQALCVAQQGSNKSNKKKAKTAYEAAEKELNRLADAHAALLPEAEYDGEEDADEEDDDEDADEEDEEADAGKDAVVGDKRKVKTVAAGTAKRTKA
jgi:hypothetical protein